MTSDEAMEAIRNTPMQFGLEAQGHLPTIRRMRSEGECFEAIAQKIGWEPGALTEHYAWYLEDRIGILSGLCEGMLDFLDDRVDGPCPTPAELWNKIDRTLASVNGSGTHGSRDALAAENEIMRSIIKLAARVVEHYATQRPDGHVCGPDAGCDAECMAAASDSDLLMRMKACVSKPDIGSRILAARTKSTGVAAIRLMAIDLESSDFDNAGPIASWMRKQAHQFDINERLGNVIAK